MCRDTGNDGNPARADNALQAGDLFWQQPGNRTFKRLPVEVIFMAFKCSGTSLTHTYKQKAAPRSCHVTIVFEVRIILPILRLLRLVTISQKTSDLANGFPADHSSLVNTTPPVPHCSSNSTLLERRMSSASI